MRIEHIAYWVKDLEASKDFFLKYFVMSTSEKYTNTTKNFSSYFLSFEGENTRIEIMARPDIQASEISKGHSFGLTHLAISVGSKEKVDQLTERFRQDGFTIIGEPRTTGDGYYESIIEDSEGNWIEITE
ncbi:VOC family protein [Flammeovirga agarivorans]|uniref:Glyoxalase/bleomycin resistance/extradiol dioxygenase family protein n=1 Tax=Flammeovirga agarivorans TaxID=2726742 RepID=A0A7X8SPE1_9BACT|nr:VOC family protein [Flammeovirga agarivorans]NLR93832.1 glyoxalase/bleomycin resistance/extradiol dioxygenase family protein [Flammeovirga agarivorans]